MSGIITIWEWSSAPANDRSLMPDSPVVYFVYTPEHGIVYIGSCVSLSNRWQSHHLRYIFRAVEGLRVAWVLQSDDADRDRVERCLIERLRPSLNFISSNTRGGTHKRDQEVARRRDVIKKLCGRPLFPV